MTNTTAAHQCRRSARTGRCLSCSVPMDAAPRPQRLIDVPVTELVAGLVVDGFGYVTAVYTRLGTTTVYVDGAVRHYHHDQISTVPVWVDAIAGGRSAYETPTGRRVLAAAGEQLTPDEIRAGDDAGLTV